MTTSNYLVFGDLHGRILPAFRLALAWQREHGERLTGLLQVGDLGFFPDPSRFDRATARHAARDPLEGGAALVARRSPEADALFGEADLPEALWFVQGNHEDFEALDALVHGPGCTPDDFPVDDYQRVRCLRDGHVLSLPGGLRVGGLWGIGQAPGARRRAHPRARLNPRSATRLLGARFDVLLSHESPLDAVFPDSGSEAISSVLRQARPAFAFFGHYHGLGRQVLGDFGPTAVYHLEGLEFRGKGHTAEEGCAGLLRWAERGGTFEYLPPAWLRTFTRHNWAQR
jgi:hypothetical protein